LDGEERVGALIGSAKDGQVSLVMVGMVGISITVLVAESDRDRSRASAAVGTDRRG